MSGFPSNNASNNPYVGWDSARDPSTGNVYYFHRDSGLTSWEWPPPMLAGMGWETVADPTVAAGIGPTRPGASAADASAARAASVAAHDEDDDECVVMTARSGLGARGDEVASAPAPRPSLVREAMVRGRRTRARRAPRRPWPIRPACPSR